MKKRGLVVVGSGPAGVSAAESFRRHDGSLPVTVLTADTESPYERPPLSKQYLRGQDLDADDIALHPRQWYGDSDVRIVAATTVERVDPSAHTIIVDGDAWPYSSLVLACGAGPVPLPVPGGEHALQLRSLTDAARLRERCAQAASAVVVGAGFIGCEAAASLALSGLAVTLVAPEQVPHAQRLGEQAGHRLLDLLRAAGVRYAGGVHVRAAGHNAVHLDNGVTVNTDVVLAATGVAPRGALARDAGLNTRQGRIVVGADMSTSAPDVYAAGDVALAHNDSAGRCLAVEHWQDAVDQGAIAGANAAGGSERWEAVPGFWSTIGDATVKYHAWGDGYQQSRMIQRDNGFAIWYARDGATVGVLTHNADDDYDLGAALIAAGEAPPVPTS